MVREILLRLPPRHLLRCRIICKAWRRLATDRALLLDHHSRQPARPLTTVHPFVAPHNNCLEAVDLRTNERRLVARFVERVHRPLFDATVAHISLEVHTSCDGLLLLSFHGVFFVCNPATRQGALLPLIRHSQEIARFYKHAASAEYRVMYHRVEGLLYIHRRYYALTLGSQEARIIGLHTATTSAAVRDGLARELAGSHKWPPLLLHGSLHWPPQQRQKGNILVFDTAVESFRWIAPPPPGGVVQNDDGDTRLFEMEGTLALHLKF